MRVRVRASCGEVCWIQSSTPLVLTYLITPWSRVHLEKLTGFQLVKKFPTFYGTWRFIIAVKSSRHLSLSWVSSIQSLTPHLTSWKIHFNIIFPSKPGSHQWSLSFRFPHQNPLCSFPLPIRATCSAHLILLDFVTRKILREYRSLTSSLCSFLHSPVTSSLLGPNNLLNPIFEAQVQEYKRGYTISIFGVDVQNLKCRYKVIFSLSF